MESRDSFIDIHQCYFTGNGILICQTHYSVMSLTDKDTMITVSS